MDFFEAQTRAKKRTARLVLLFALAVAGTIAATYFGFILLAACFNLRITANGGGLEADRNAFDHLVLWQPGAFNTVAAFTLVVVGLSTLFKWMTLRQGGAAVAAMVGGRRIDPRTTETHERRLLNVVEEMSIAAGLSVPAVFVLDDEPGLNAFAAGLTTGDAAVAVTRGLLQRLDRDELQGVIGHEFSHILNGDMRLNLRLTALLYGILAIGLLGRGLLRGLRHVRGRGGKNNGGGIVVALAAVGLLLLIVGYTGYFFGRLIQAAVSRQREFLADASAVQFTRHPQGIADALKKIGGLALGGTLYNDHAAEIRHFFFAQAFRSGFDGLFATHPPLAERIRAIDASFDGTFIEPPPVVDVARQSFVDAGLAPAFAPHPASAAIAPPPLPDAHAIVHSVGTIELPHLRNAQALLERIPTSLHNAAHASPAAVVCGLLLDDNTDAQPRQLGLLAQHADIAVARETVDLHADLRALPPEARLPLLQLCAPGLQALPAEELDRLLTLLDELVHADSHVTTFEFALQKVISRHLRLGRAPAGPGGAIHSFVALASEINLVLSALAHASGGDGKARRAFAAGERRLKLLEGRLALIDSAACHFEALDAALDRLADASPPIKRQVLEACALVITADHEVRVAELELLRAFASAIDCPVPALVAPALRPAVG